MTTTQVRSTGAAASPQRAVPANQQALLVHLLDSSGGTVRAGAVAKRLGVPVTMIEQLRQAGRLLGVPDNRGYSYPIWQFEGRGLLAGLPTVLAALRRADPWQQVAFVLMPHAELGDQCPLDHLRAGDVGAVLRAARSERPMVLE